MADCRRLLAAATDERTKSGGRVWSDIGLEHSVSQRCRVAWLDPPVVQSGPTDLLATVVVEAPPRDYVERRSARPALNRRSTGRRWFVDET
jgi:hypothetical protein